MNQIAAITATRAPALIAAAGDRASYRYIEFFTAQIRNPNTSHGLRKSAEAV